MPWNNQTGGPPGNGGRGPWGGGPSGTQPPDLEELLKKGQEKLRGMLPGGFGRSSALIAVLSVGVVWALSGIYVVQPDQQGVVLRFGKYVAKTDFPQRLDDLLAECQPWYDKLYAHALRASAP